MRVWGIVGAGAVGGYFGYRLARAGERVRFLVRGRTLQALSSRGLELISQGIRYRCEVEASEDPGVLSGCQTVLLAVKNLDLGPALALVRKGLDAGSFAVTLQNGVDAPALAGRVLGEGNVVAGITYLGAECIAPGEILHMGLGRLMVGEPGGGSSARCDLLAADLESAGIPARASDRIVEEMWKKLAWNAAFNGPTALARCSPGALVADPEAQALCRQLIAEVVEAAGASGVKLPPGLADDQIQLGAGLTELRTSMLQDLEAGRPLEIEALYLRTLSVLGSLGKKASAHRSVVGLLRACGSAFKGAVRSRESPAASRRSRR